MRMLKRRRAPAPLTRRLYLRPGIRDALYLRGSFDGIPPVWYSSRYIC